MASPKKKVKKKTVKKKVTKKVVPKKLGQYSTMVMAAHEKWQATVKEKARGQSVGMMKRLRVEALEGGVRATYTFNWRGVPDDIGMDKLSELAMVGFEAMEWADPPAITVVPNEAPNDHDVTFNW